MYTLTLPSVTSCDTLLTLNLTVNPAITTNLSAQICTGQTYLFNGQNLTLPGLYIDSSQTSITGCDSIIVLTLSVDSILNQSVAASICAGGGFIFHGDTLTEGGIYTTILPSVTSCDTLLTLTLTVTPAITTNVAAQICAGQTYLFNGQSLTLPGLYIDSSLTSITGCDSIIVLILSVDSILNQSIMASICAGGGYIFHGDTLTEGGIYTTI